MQRSYRELLSYHTFEERFDYLQLRGLVGHDTFGYDRWINQQFYRSSEWRNLRHFVITRDMGNDLGIPGHEIVSNGHIHHMNPISLEDIQDGNPDILDPEFLITVSQLTHNAIHYGTARPASRVPVVREPGDTVPW